MINGFTADGRICGDSDYTVDFTLFGKIDACTTPCITPNGDPRKMTYAAWHQQLCRGQRTHSSDTKLKINLRAWEDDGGGRCNYNSGWRVVNDDDCYQDHTVNENLPNTNGAWKQDKLCKGAFCMYYQYKTSWETPMPSPTPSPPTPSPPTLAPTPLPTPKPTPSPTLAPTEPIY